MEESVQKKNQQLFQQISNYIQNNKDKIYIIGINGIPGSGKTTTASILNRVLPHSKIIPMDGYHIYRKDLTQEQMIRRGAPYTFDNNKFKEDIENLKKYKEGKFPSFDHSKKDPVENDIIITKDDKFIIIEGLYLFLNDWDMQNIFDLKISVDCEFQIAEERLIKRHVKAGIVKNEEEARVRVKNNDQINGQYLKDNSQLDKNVIILNTDNDLIQCQRNNLFIM